MRYYLFLLLCPALHSVCLPGEPLPECLARKKNRKQEPELNGDGEYEDDFVEAGHSGLGKECFKLKIRIKFHLHKLEIQFNH